MRSLRDRLAQFDRPAHAKPAHPPATSPTGSPLAGLLDAGALWVGTPPTGHLRLEVELPTPLESPWQAIPAPAWGLLGATTPAADHWVVLDTETTGLESGTGTLVFLVGLLHWTPTRTWKVQLFLPEPAGEAGLLRALAGELATVDAVLSYNGRGFDVPRLRSRLHLQRMDVACLERVHLDLLFPARRLLRPTFGDVRLGTLERELLRRPRTDDLPGEFAPEVYRSLIADGVDGGLAAVVLHNARDVESLPEIAGWLARAVLDPSSVEIAAEGCLAVARLHLLRGDRVRAESLLRDLVDGPEPGLRVHARRELAVLLRRDRRYDEAAHVWRSQIEELPSDVGAHVELAKLCEHRLGDLHAAQACVLGAMGQDRAHDELDRRLQRIRRKLRRKADRV